MKIKIIAVGSKMPAWVKEGYTEYEKRLPKELKPELIEVPVAVAGKNAKPEQLKQVEGLSIVRHVSDSDYTIALDLKGKLISTENLANKIGKFQMEGHNINILIGGPNGFSPECLAVCKERWCLSNMTLPHPLVRIVLIEQLYRAWSILHNHPYHK